ncbi:MAG: PEP/pyruvate-binding domain-containing protein, partial [Rhodothermales bacterium]|nr:PEP/pyruvate-binding domain-containing protein [Rhodothermales bacterium]
ADDVEFKPDKVYVVGRAPADLKPVAGIATVSEGNIVSHVQLLARNLGIPNAVVSPALLRELESFSGSKVFYAVSPGGVVRMKPATSMTPAETALVEERQRSEERILVPTERLDLDALSLENLYELRADDSGVICGPKAANLGQLSSLFPGRVAPGFIVPFGVFRRHMDQTMPGTGGTYWQFLEETFASAAQRRTSGDREDQVDDYVLERLANLRSAIEAMPLHADFVAEVRARFSAIFGAPVGSAAVFVRSDTNMEDLKDFTGAGLNLTVPNVVSETDLLRAVRRVWASPYRERGYRWRQKYLLNPEDVYPSLLILRSVNVDRSGVMITTGISSGNRSHATIAFNRGVGGAVDGQAAESYLLTDAGPVLESPAREPRYTVLPSSGGVERRITSFNRRILSEDDLNALASLAQEIRQKLPGTPGIETQGPFDVELGFIGDEMRLFQTRPFVENRAAASTLYLSAMDTRTTSRQSIQASDRVGRD